MIVLEETVIGYALVGWKNRTTEGLLKKYRKKKGGYASHLFVLFNNCTDATQRQKIGSVVI